MIKKIFNVNSRQGFYLALVIKLLLIINFFYIYGIEIERESTSAPPYLPFVGFGFALSFINAILFPVSFLGVVGLIILISSEKSNPSFIRKTIYFICWYLTLNIPTVLFFGGAPFSYILNLFKSFRF